MKDKSDKIIYVGKSRKLKNRVSQYFQNSKKNIKTEKMVNSVEDFDYILCKSEIEALSLENVLIKQHSPKYNIKLKDSKSYPYIKMTAEAYPRLVFTRHREADKAKYFGPFSGVNVAYSIMNLLRKTLGIPRCKLVFPRDIGKERPCLYYYMKKCCGVCTGRVSKEEYAEIIECASEVLRGHKRNAIQALEKQMYLYSEREQYESAARCRDAISALQKLGETQNVVASPDLNADVFGLYSDGTFACISVMYIRDGVVTIKNDFSIGTDAITDSADLCSFLVEHYMMSSYIPKLIAVSFKLDDADKADIEDYLSERLGSKVEVRYPERGNLRELCKTVTANAEEKVKQDKLDAQKDEQTLYDFARILGLDTLPVRIEAYDISNIGSENITAGMVVFKNGLPSREDYRSFNIRSVVDKADDYASMREALTRRLKHLGEDTVGSFSEYPDLLLIDGGKGHVSVACEVVREMGFDIPVFGMVKDEFHKTRALCNEEQEISIARDHSIFIMVYKIQDEVHRYTVGRTTNAKRKTLKHSSLEKIKGIGAAKAKKLLSAMKTLSAIKEASVGELEVIDGISKTDAYNIYAYFHQNDINGD